MKVKPTILINYEILNDNPTTKLDIFLFSLHQKIHAKFICSVHVGYPIVLNPYNPSDDGAPYIPFTTSTCGSTTNFSNQQTRYPTITQ